MRIGFFGGVSVFADERPVAVTGTMQLAVLFRLAVDAGRAVSYRSIVEDVWSADAPANERAALQSVVSRLRTQLPAGAIESTAGGYRLAVARSDVDILAFEDLVAAASAAVGQEAARLASEALALWTGEPWVPSENFDWVERDLARDRAVALRRGGVATAPRDGHVMVPTPLTSLVGRQVELEQIAEQLATNRLVTIVGTGGAGKTRLAIETALSRPGSLLVELAPAGPGELLAAVLAATGRELRTETLTDRTGSLQRIIDTLFGRDILMVMDNCEHVIGEAAALVEELLGRLPRLRILATSREPLAVPGEAFVAVGSLAHPGSSEGVDPLDYPAVELFRQRAAAARGTDLEPGELQAAAMICSRLDGLPLAIELAAARLRTMSLDEVLDGLEHRFTLLTGGYRTALPRHQTLRAMIDWSWSLLSDDERFVLARLAVFPAGVDARDAGRLADAMGGVAASLFDSLVDKSLLQRSRGRYRTLETIREYGIERLAEQGSTVEARTLQATFASAGAHAADALMRGPRIGEAIEWFDAEEDNISAALRFAIATPLPEAAVGIATACTWYWVIRGRQEDASAWFPLVLPLAEGVEGEEAEVLRLIAPPLAAFSTGEAEGIDPSEIFSRSAKALEPLASLEVRAGMNELIQVMPAVLGAFAAVAGRADWMVSVRIPPGEELGLDPWPVALIHVMRAAMAQNRGDIDELGVESEIAYRMFAEIGDLWGLALSSQMRAEWLIVNGELEEALRVSDESTRDLRSITSSWDLAQQQGQAIIALTRLGRIDEARERVAEVLAEHERTGNARARLQANQIGGFVDLIARDVPALDERLAIIHELDGTAIEAAPQSAAFIGVLRGGRALLVGDRDAAELHLRAAAEAAFASHDQPVIGLVAINLGLLAVARGDFNRALHALDLATALIGTYDATNPQVRQIEEAARDAGFERASAAALTRPKALEALAALVKES